MKLKINFKNFCTRKKFNVLFFGNDQISLPTLIKMHEETQKENTIINKIGIITTPIENKKSTQAVFSSYLTSKNLQTFYLDNKKLKESWDEVQKEINKNEFNIGIIASFGKMVPGRIIKSLSNGAFVMHPSLLPKYRGASPIQHTLLNKEKTAGVSLVEASIGKFDAGSLISKKEIEMQPFYRFKELSGILADEGGNLVLDFLFNYENLIAKKVPQDEALAIPAPLIDDSNYVYLDFVNQSADEIIILYKSFYGSQLTPYTKLTIKGEERRMFFDNLFLVTDTNEAYVKLLKDWDKPGSIFWDTKYNMNNVYIRSKTNWFVTTKVKLDKTDFMNCDMLIRKIFTNSRYKDKKQTQLNFNTLAKEI